MLSEARAFCRQAINVGRLNFCLSVTSQFAVAKVIGEDEDNIPRARWLGRFYGTCTKTAKSDDCQEDAHCSEV